MLLWAIVTMYAFVWGLFGWFLLSQESEASPAKGSPSTGLLYALLSFVVLPFGLARYRIGGRR